MRYYLLTILLLLAQIICAQVSHQFRNTPLIDAIRTIEQGQTEYTVSILSDGLTYLTTSARIDEEDALRAIKSLCKGLGVKVKEKNGNINVQAKASLKDVPSHQLILGSVRDGFLKIPLPNARVSLLTTDSIIVQDSITVTMNKKDGERYGTAMFSLQVPNQTNTYLLRATLAGYEDAWQILKVKGGIDYPWGLDSPLELRRILERTLDEVAVTATRLKMFYKGDTSIEGQARTANVEELLNGVKSYVEERQSEMFEEMQSDGEVVENDCGSVVCFSFFENAFKPVVLFSTHNECLCIGIF